MIIIRRKRKHDDEQKKKDEDDKVYLPSIHITSGSISPSGFQLILTNQQSSCQFPIT